MRNTDNQVDYEEIRSSMNLFLNVLQKTMITTNIILGIDLENKKLVLKHTESNAISRVDLGELNKTVINIKEENIND